MKWAEMPNLFRADSFSFHPRVALLCDAHGGGAAVALILLFCAARFQLFILAARRALRQ